MLRFDAVTSEDDASAVQFREWAKAARHTALCHADRGDEYCVQLSAARAEVYRAAAKLVENHNEAEAVAAMLDRAARLRVHTPPLVDFDEAGLLRYIQARAWQFCAHHLDPNAPEVQPAWPAD